MSSSCLKLLLALTLFVIITECRPQVGFVSRVSRRGGCPGYARPPPPHLCPLNDPLQYDNGWAECSEGFSCVETQSGLFPYNRECVKSATKPSKYKNTD